MSLDMSLIATPIKTSLMQIKAVWRAASQARTNAVEVDFLSIAIGLCIIATVFVSFMSLCIGIIASNEISALIAFIKKWFAYLSVVIYVLSLPWLFSFVRCARRQYSPANAALVPGLQRQVKLAFAVPVFISLLLLISFGVLFSWKDNYQLVLGYILIGMIVGITVGARWWGIWILMGASQLLIKLMALIVTAYMLIYDTLKLGVLYKDGAASSLFSSAQLLIAQYGAQHVANALMLALLTLWIFPKRDRLFDRFAQSFQRPIKGESAPAKQFGLWQILCSYPYRRWNQYVLGRTSSKTIQTPEKLLPLAFGPSTHWTLQMARVCLIVGCFIISNLLEGKANFFVFPVFILLMLLGFLPFSLMLSCDQALHLRGNEQAVISLAAKTPKHQLQTKIWTSHLLRQYLICWGISFMAAGVLMRALRDKPLMSMKLQAGIYLAYCCLLIVSVPMLNNHAKQDQSGLKYADATFLMLLIFAITLAISYVLPFQAVCAAITVIVLLVLRVRWVRLMKIDCVFPAGRAV